MIPAEDSNAETNEGEQVNKILRLMILVTILTLIAVNPYPCSAEKTVLHAFDRDACYANCGCDAVGMVSECFDCKQECDRKFWADFDRETGSDDKSGSANEDN